MTDFVLKDFLPYQLAVLSAQISGEFSNHYRDAFGISTPEWRVMAHLSQTNAPVSVREIFGQVAMDKSKVSRAASRLERLGYVIKSQSAEDGRLIELSLSAAGRNVIRTLMPEAQQFEDKVLKCLGTDAATFREALVTLVGERPTQTKENLNG